jgi:hypothetical protein
VRGDAARLRLVPILDLGGYAHLNYGGFSSCDDLIRDFFVSSVN